MKTFTRRKRSISEDVESLTQDASAIDAGVATTSSHASKAAAAAAAGAAGAATASQAAPRSAPRQLRGSISSGTAPGPPQPSPSHPPSQPPLAQQPSPAPSTSARITRSQATATTPAGCAPQDPDNNTKLPRTTVLPTSHSNGPATNPKLGGSPCTPPSSSQRPPPAASAPKSQRRSGSGSGRLQRMLDQAQQSPSHPPQPLKPAAAKPSPLASAPAPSSLQGSGSAPRPAPADGSVDSSLLPCKAHDIRSSEVAALMAPACGTASSPGPGSAARESGSPAGRTRSAARGQAAGGSGAGASRLGKGQHSSPSLPSQGTGAGEAAKGKKGGGEPAALPGSEAAGAVGNNSAPAPVDAFEFEIQDSEDLPAAEPARAFEFETQESEVVPAALLEEEQDPQADGQGQGCAAGEAGPGSGLQAAGQGARPEWRAGPGPAAGPQQQQQAPVMFGCSLGAQGFVTELNPAQTVAEAQERGEQVQVVDDAIYALDGMSASCSLGTQRDSITTLAELMATRRGRAALRSDGMCQQILTAAAKLRGQADPVLALSASCLLLSLSMPDVHPSYLASSASAVLAAQLLQVEHDLAGLAETAAGGGGLDPGLRPALARAMQVACEGQLGRQLSAELQGPPDRAAGPVVGAVGGQGPAVVRLRSHAPLVLLALARATSTDRNNVRFAERVKDNLRKVKALDHLVTLVATRHLALERHLIRTTPMATAAATHLVPQPGPQATAAEGVASDGAAPSQAQAGPVSAAAAGEGIVAMDVAEGWPAGAGAAEAVDPWEFPCGSSQAAEQEQEQERGAARARGQRGPRAGAGSGAGGSSVPGPDAGRARGGEAAAVAAPLLECEGGVEEGEGRGKGGGEGEGCDVEGVLVEVRLCLLVLENASFTCPENEAELLRMQVDLRTSGDAAADSEAVGTAGAGAAEPKGAGAAGGGLIPLLLLLMRLLATQLTPPAGSGDGAVAPGMNGSGGGGGGRLRGCLHSALGVLMNLTHQHEDGVQAVVEAGALQIVAGLLWACCGLPQLAVHAAAVRLQQGGLGELCDGAGGMDVDPGPGGSLRPDRGSILSNLDLVTVGFGLLINVVSMSGGNRGRLRGLALQQAGGEGTGVVALLCSIFNVISEEGGVGGGQGGSQDSQGGEDSQRAVEGSEGGGGGGGGGGGRGGGGGEEADVGHSVLPRVGSVPGAEHMDVTVDDLQSGHQEGEVAIVQAYSAMLLGFLVMDSAAARASACTLLRCGGLGPLSTCIRRCLSFYTYTGAISEPCRAALVQLLQGLAAPAPGA